MADNHGMVPLIFEVAPEGDTFPKLVRRNAEKIPGKVAIREKNFGIWQSFTWRDYYEQSRLIALGLASLGLRRGDMMAVVGDNRPQLYWAMTAAQSIGGIPVPLFQDSIEAEMQFIIDHAEVKIAVVEDQEQVDKLLHIKEKSAHIEYIVYEESRGMRH
ncbi:MAG: AMP-binding protein, partial [bacterium]